MEIVTRFTMCDIIDVRSPRALNEPCGNLRCKLERDFSRSSAGGRFIDITPDIFFLPNVTWYLYRAILGNHIIKRYYDA